MIAEPLLSDLRREIAELEAAIAEDDDWHGRDHWPNGRWPMIHNLATRIAEMEKVRK